jgi:hypothetical protein
VTAALRAGVIVLTLGLAPVAAAARPCDTEDVETLAALLAELGGEDGTRAADDGVLWLLAAEAGCEWLLDGDDPGLQLVRLAEGPPALDSPPGDAAVGARLPWWRGLLPRIELRWMLRTADCLSLLGQQQRRGASLEIWFLWTVGALSW